MPRKSNVTTGGGVSVSPASVSGDPQSLNPMVEGYVGSSYDPALKAHLQAQPPLNSIPGFPSGTVYGALVDLASAQPPEPPKLGQSATWTAFSGITDWGVLKLAESSLVSRGLISSTNDPKEIYPYYWRVPGPSLGVAEQGSKGFVIPGQDPQTDPVFNTNLTSADGCGIGSCYAGGFTHDPNGAAPQPLVRTARIIERTTIIDGITGLPERQPVTISGTLYPADRGVLALLHWPSQGDVPAFLAQSLSDRCVAAILLGQGILSNAGGGGCSSSCDIASGDGDPGGIFALGDVTPSDTFPGRWSGQYDLSEIHNGVDDLDGNPLNAPYNDFDGDGNPGAVRTYNGTIPAPGQVRLGTTIDTDPTGYGIPILGGSVNAYSPAPVTTSSGHTVVGNTVVQTASANQLNFFGYRLPYLKDYSTLHYTPKGSSNTTRETFRFFSVKSPSSGTFTSAGGYTDFGEDYPTWQIARYRHTFLLPSTVAGREDVGSYVLVHFKTEKDFESYVVDGVMPWDITSGYEVYGYSLVDTSSIESEGNVANLVTDPTVPAPDGVAPTYGYIAKSYHSLRANIVLDPPVAFPTMVSELDWAYTSPEVMWVSGVAYFIPRIRSTGADNWKITRVSAGSTGTSFWDTTYRTDSYPLNFGTPPARLSSMCPLFFGVAPFAYGPHPSNAYQPSLDIPTGSSFVFVAPFVGDADNPMLQRIEVPYTHAGVTGAGQFAESNAPLSSSFLVKNVVQDMPLKGDVDIPSFSDDVKMRVFFRQPLGHQTANNSTLPYAALDGHGIIMDYNSPVTSRLLLHSTRWDEINQIGSFGNFVDNTLPSPTTSFASLRTSYKDITERFLDEVYRWDGDFPNADTIIAPGATDALKGPGLGAWWAPIEIPVQASDDSTGWSADSWLLTRRHEMDVGSICLQVAGLPDRNPPITGGQAVPFPSSGVLLYPYKDYTAANTRPDSVLDTLTTFAGPAAQPDYTGYFGSKSYVRAFDVSASRSASPVTVTDYVKLRFDGIQLADFRFTGGGPGRLDDNALAIGAKVPGLTTWMDVGRVQGAGPSKQSPTLDGAGCLILDADTFDGVDPITGVVYCQVKIYVGPGATLFTSANGEVPLLVRVQMKEGAANSYDFQTVGGIVTPGASPSDVRGLVGMRIVL